MQSLLSVISYAFQSPGIYTNYIPEANLETKETYMTIPISKDIVEIPLIAMARFIQLLKTNSIENYDALVVSLKQRRGHAGYKTVDANIRHFLQYNYPDVRLLPIHKDVAENPYYCAKGIIADCNYHPIMLQSWEIQLSKDAEGHLKWSALAPIIRITPEVILKRDKMEKYIYNKFLPLITQNTHILPPRGSFEDYKSRSLRIIIEKCPFKLTSTDQPSVSTTNQELLEIALNYIDEVVQ